ncbi:MAG: ZPR1 zinc finger domain-containing protein [Promethearchaeota archaeon]|jgi:zinc finger protein
MTQEEFSIKCPACTQGIIKINKTVYDLPDKDKMLMLKFECDKCSFLKNDIIPLTTNMDSGIMTLEVTNEADLKSKIYRSPMGKIEIPDLELVVEPGPRADFYFTNVEGILLRFEKAVSIYRNNIEEDDQQVIEIEELLNDLKKAMKGQLKFTLVITDTQGGSYIIPHDKSKYTFEKLKEK